MASKVRGDPYALPMSFRPKSNTTTSASSFPKRYQKSLPTWPVLPNRILRYGEPRFKALLKKYPKLRRPTFKEITAHYSHKGLKEEGKTWETGPPVPQNLITYGTSTPAPDNHPLLDLEEKESEKRGRDVASLSRSLSFMVIVMIIVISYSINDVTWHLSEAFGYFHKPVPPYIWEHQQDVGGATYFPVKSVQLFS